MGFFSSVFLSIAKGMHNYNKTQDVTRKMDNDPNCTIKTDRWYREHNTTPKEQEKLRNNESMQYRKEHGDT